MSRLSTGRGKKSSATLGKHRIDGGGQVFLVVEEAFVETGEDARVGLAEDRAVTEDLAEQSAADGGKVDEIDGASGSQRQAVGKLAAAPDRHRIAQRHGDVEIALEVSPAPRKRPEKDRQPEIRFGAENGEDLVGDGMHGEAGGKSKGRKHHPGPIQQGPIHGKCLGSGSVGVPPAFATTHFPPDGGPSREFRSKASDAAKMVALLEAVANAIFS